jgi:hypothetical protein
MKNQSSSLYRGGENRKEKPSKAMKVFDALLKDKRKAARYAEARKATA